ncbi:hypothetical protein DPMN_100403 [Dreissena polymorpha]|uniref:Uncharacterized protein n=1 Tax=Dreissena polymorpha TaxID=45954 RepID=A0A9D4R869_DREPO|nr:hypothetical protein DPMN_100403 [Dreissena polymorpha]
MRKWFGSETSGNPDTPWNTVMSPWRIAVSSLDKNVDKNSRAGVIGKSFTRWTTAVSVVCGEIQVQQQHHYTNARSAISKCTCSITCTCTFKY